MYILSIFLSHFSVALKLLSEEKVSELNKSLALGISAPDDPVHIVKLSRLKTREWLRSECIFENAIRFCALQNKSMDRFYFEGLYSLNISACLEGFSVPGLCCSV